MPALYRFHSFPWNKLANNNNNDNNDNEKRMYMSAYLATLRASSPLVAWQRQRAQATNKLSVLFHFKQACCLAIWASSKRDTKHVMLRARIKLAAEWSLSLFVLLLSSLFRNGIQLRMGASDELVSWILHAKHSMQRACEFAKINEDLKRVCTLLPKPKLRMQPGQQASPTSCLIWMGAAGESDKTESESGSNDDDDVDRA